MPERANKLKKGNIMIITDQHTEEQKKIYALLLAGNSPTDLLDEIWSDANGRKCLLKYLKEADMYNTEEDLVGLFDRYTGFDTGTPIWD